MTIRPSSEGVYEREGVCIQGQTDKGRVREPGCHCGLVMQVSESTREFERQKEVNTRQSVVYIKWLSIRSLFYVF